MTIGTAEDERDDVATAEPRPPSLRERQRQEREQLILKAAADLLAEKGYHEMSIEEIAARVGTSKGTIYLHFASKEDLVVALLERGMRLFTQAMEDGLSRAGTPREKIAALFEYVFGTISDEGFKLTRTAFESPEIHSRLAAKRTALAELMERPRKRIRAVIEEGKASGEFDPAMPTSLMVLLLTNLIHPMTYQRLVAEEHLPPEEVIRHVRQFFFKGVAAAPPDAT